MPPPASAAANAKFNSCLHMLDLRLWRLVLSQEGHLCCYYEAFDGGPIDSSGR